MISCYVLISWHPKKAKTWRLYWFSIKLGCFCICEMQNDHFYEVGSSYDEFDDMDKFKICFHFNPYLEIVDKKSTNWDLRERHLWTKNPQKFFLGMSGSVICGQKIHTTFLVLNIWLWKNLEFFFAGKCLSVICGQKNQTFFPI